MTQKQDTVHYNEVSKTLHSAQMTSGCCHIIRTFKMTEYGIQ